MNRGALLLLVGAALAIMAFSGSEARNSVSLIGLNADRANGRAVIELLISGQAEFHVSRFTAGDWISIWSDSFELSDGVSEIPLELNRPELADLVSGAALVNEQRKATVRIYLGPQADRRGAFISTKDDRVVVYVPALAVPVAAPVEPEQLESESTPDAGTPSEILAEAAPAEIPEEIPVEMPTMLAEPLDVDAGRPVTTGSFYLPRNELDPDVDQPDMIALDTEPVVPPTPKVDPPAPKNNPVPIPFNGPTEQAASISQFENPTSLAEMNYQYLREDTGGADKPADQGAAGTPSLEEMMEAATQVASDMLGDMLTETGQPQDATAAPTQSIRTTGGFFDPYQAAATVAAGLPSPIANRDSKEALADIQIELFEIVSAPLDQAITLLVAPTDYNIIVDASVGSNSVSLTFKDGQTSLKSALDLLTRTYGLAYSVQSSTIVVAAKGQIEGQLVSYATRLFVLSFADPASVKTVLQTTGLLMEDQIEVYKGEEEYGLVNDSTELSTESASEGTEVKRIETNLSSTPRNAVLVKAVPEQMDVIAEVIATLDRRPRIIELEVRVCEASDTALRNLGISIYNNDQATPTPLVTTWSEIVDAAPLAGLAGGNEDFSLGSFSRSPSYFLAQLNSQIQDGSVELLAQPTLSTVEGKQAIYFAGERLPYIAKVTQTQTGQQIEIDFLNVGVTLNFKPRLDNDGQLTIDVNPIVSSLLEFRMIGELMEAPRTSSRQMASTVRVADNEPFVLAGLITETERKTITKVPLLGDLPLLGKLFRNKNVKGERTEIVVVVIPHISE